MNLINGIRNLSRYWVDKHTGIIMRQWTSEEYEAVSPRTHIFEMYWSYQCPICSFLPVPHCNEVEAMHGANTHERYAGSRHRCVVEHREHELVCLECKEEYVDELGVWVNKQEIM